MDASVVNCVLTWKHHNINILISAYILVRVLQNTVLQRYLAVVSSETLGYKMHCVKTYSYLFERMGVGERQSTICCFLPNA